MFTLQVQRAFSIANAILISRGYLYDDSIFTICALSENLESNFLNIVIELTGKDHRYLKKSLLTLLDKERPSVSPGQLTSVDLHFTEEINTRCKNLQKSWGKSYITTDILFVACVELIKSYELDRCLVDNGITIEKFIKVARSGRHNVEKVSKKELLEFSFKHLQDRLISKPDQQIYLGILNLLYPEKDLEKLNKLAEKLAKKLDLQSLWQEIIKL